MEEVREQEERGSLVKAVAIFMDETAAAAREGILFQEGDFEAGVREAGGCCNAAYAGAC